MIIKNKMLKFKIKNLFFALLYVILFILAYKQFLYFYFEYAGFEINNDINSNILFSILFALVPIFFYHGFRYVSSAFSALIYILLYIPIIITFYFISKLGAYHTISIQLLFCICMIILFLSDCLSFKIKHFNYTIKVRYIFSICLVLCLYLLMIYRSNLRFVSFDDVYEQRADNNQLGTDLVTSYFSSWLYNVFIPICFSYGIFYKKRVGLIIGIAGCVIIYMSTASKAAILLPLIYLGFFLIVRKNIFIFLEKTLKYLSVIIFGLLSVDFNFFSSILLSRTIGNGGLLTFWYYDFFLNHSKTYYSHINIINLFTQNYPYGNKGLGQVVGPYYWGDLMNANANFWATDGIASFGLFGVLIITIVVFIFLVFLNGVTKAHDKLFVFYCFLPFVLSLTNTSFFSSLLTGGGGLLTFFFMFKKRDYSNA